MEENKVKLSDILGKIMTDKVEISEQDYKEMLKAVAGNYNKINKTGGKLPTLSERRKRIQTNYYGQSINMLYQILNLQTSFIEQVIPVIEAIADKVGVQFEQVKTADEKAMEAAAEYLKAGAEKRRLEVAELERKK
jgi:hypothetical protein